MASILQVTQEKSKGKEIFPFYLSTFKEETQNGRVCIVNYFFLLFQGEASLRFSMICTHQGVVGQNWAVTINLVKVHNTFVLTKKRQYYVEIFSIWNYLDILQVLAILMWTRQKELSCFITKW